LLSQAGIEFVVRIPPEVDESVWPHEKPEEYVQRVAEEKALAAAAGSGEIILGADTTVVIDGHMLGKPVDDADAARMLARLSGRRHEVVTGICLRFAGKLVRDWATTQVWFADLSQSDIQAYIASGEPHDKAGAYAIQGLASKFVERIDGSYSNVVGLPVALVWKYLREG